MYKKKLKQILNQLFQCVIEPEEAFEKIWGQEFQETEQPNDIGQIEVHPLGSYIEDPVTDAISQYNIGCEYLHGKDGFEKDLSKALDWFRKSAAQGDIYAKKVLLLAWSGDLV